MFRSCSWVLVYIFQTFKAGAAGQTRQNQPGAVQAPQQPQQAMNIMPVSQPSMISNAMTGQQSFPGQPGIRAPGMNQVKSFLHENLPVLC